MSGDGTEDITIPAVFMKKGDASVLRELLKLEKSVYVLLTWMPALESGTGMRKEDDKGEEASKEKGGVVNGIDSGEESRSGESGLYDSGTESRTMDSGLYNGGMETSESDYKQPHKDSAQPCSSTADCNSPP